MTDTTPNHGQALGTLLARHGVITVEQLEQALAEKERSGARIGDILVAHGWVTTSDLARVLAEQYSLEFVEILETPIEPEVTKLLSERFVRRFRALPVKYLTKNSVLVAIGDPTDIVALDDVKLALGINLKFCLANASDLDRAIDQVYAQRPTLHIVDEPTEPEQIEPEFELRDIAGDASPVVSLINQILTQAIEDRASDAHFEPQERQMIARVRVDGVVRDLASIPKAMQQAVTSRLKVMGQLDIAERGLPQDGRCAVRLGANSIDLRIAILPTSHGEKVTVRILQRSSAPVSLPDLGMSERAYATFLHAIDQPFGCVIACGPTGVGKTTTLYAALEYLNTSERIITTIEDPIEYEIAGVSQVQTNLKRGLTFARGLRTMLRSDPDVLLVGEIRDGETAEIAVQAALTGHLVLTTLHTQSAAGAFARLQDMGVPAFMLANTINCAVSQRLVRKLCTECRRESTASAAECAELGIAAGASATIYHPGGCRRCKETGYLGRTAIYEVLPMTSEIRKLIGSSTEDIHDEAVRAGMVTLHDDGCRVVLSGETSLDEVRRVVGDGH
ncbi:MAG: GspE/PulE family protein [Gaiellaceae bacterium]|jgi:type II secretory ATPase GspE/PulE/Tfp pilus assembly ATPase PilB-like protein